MAEENECLDKLICEWLHTLIKKDWSLHIEKIIKIYSGTYQQDECWYYSNATNIIYNNNLDIIGYINDNGIIKYF
jgi:hypothetical protein